MKKTDNTLVDFLLSPAYKFQRHLLFISVLVIMSADIALNQPVIYQADWGTVIGVFSYIGLVASMIYLTAVVMVPRLLLRNKLLFFILSVMSMIVIVTAGLFIIQIVFFDLLEGAFRISNRMLLNILSSVVLIGLMFAGVTTMMLFRYWLASTRRVSELESATLQTELKFLRNQINPHFLFNMLNNAHALYRDKKQEASATLYKLEDLLRYQIDESSKESTSLVSDIHFLNDYLNLEKIRRDGFSFSIIIDGDISDIQLPPLLFIPFVENAVKHSQDSECLSSIDIRFIAVGNVLSFHCENSMPVGYSPPERAGGIGLKNIRRRLELLFADKHQLRLSEEKGKYIVDLQLYFK